jgi:hypothetical protein
MGLDQYAFIVTKHKDNTDFNVHWLEDGVSESMKSKNVALIAQWRKHPYLQGWMENLFNSKADNQNWEGKVMPGGMGDKISINASSLENTKVALDPEVLAKINEALSKINETIKQVASEGKLQRVFNNQTIRLTLTDLDQLETAVNRGELPESSGFFWGDDSSEYYKEADLEFISSARMAIENGNEIYYDSSW